jgi:subtilisin family serine protease
MVRNKKMPKNNTKSSSTGKKNQLNLKLAAVVVLMLGAAIFLSTDTGKGLLGFDPDATGSKANQGKFRKSENAVPGQYIVVLEDNEKDVPGKALGLAKQHNGKNKHIYESAIKGFSTEMSEADALALSEDPSVEYVEEEFYVETQIIQQGATWGISRIDNKNPYVYPLDDNYEYNATGSGVHAYILDTRVWADHPDFEGRANFAYDVFNDPRPHTECNAHGSHVAGIVGSETYGIAKNVSIHSVAVIPCSGAGTSGSVIAGINWVINNLQKPAVANMSFSAKAGQDNTIDTAVKNMIQRGVVAVASAGNYQEDACNYSPARVKEVLTVSGTHGNDSINFNYGRCVDLYAPGINILSTWNNSLNQLFGAMSGTSMASPHGAGVAALYLETRPTASPAEVHSAIVSAATPNLLYGDLKGGPNLLLYSLFTGGDSTPPPPTSDTTPPAVSFTSPSNGAVIRRGNMKIAAKAQDSSGISEIVLSLDGSIIKTCYDITTCSASVSANNLTAGSHTLTATAKDRAGTPNTGSSSVVVTKQ